MIKYENHHWPKNLVDLLNKHWVMSSTTDAIISKNILWTVFRTSDKGANLIDDTLDYINGCYTDTQYTIDDAEKVLSMLDEIGRMFNVSRKIERKNAIQNCGTEYEA